MSGSEFERGNIVTDALPANPLAKPFEQAFEQPLREHTWRPPAEGLYDLSQEKDACGVGFIANIKGRKSHQIVSDALSILCNLEHRGAVGADPRAGDSLAAKSGSPWAGSRPACCKTGARGWAASCHATGDSGALV